MFGFRISLSFLVFVFPLNLIRPKELPGDLFMGWKTDKIFTKWIA